MIDLTGAEVVDFAERERDLAEMTILRLPSGRLVARRRETGEAATGRRGQGAYDDRWRHVRSGGEYLRRDDVFDMEDGVDCYDYVAMNGGRHWLRSRDEWQKVQDGRARFERVDATGEQAAYP